jgi:hypothetical protein
LVAALLYGRAKCPSPILQIGQKDCSGAADSRPVGFGAVEIEDMDVRSVEKDISVSIVIDENRSVGSVSDGTPEDRVLFEEAT